MQLAVKEWRVRCSAESREARIVGIVSGSKASQLAGGNLDDMRQAYGNATAGGETSVAYYLGRLAGTDLGYRRKQPGSTAPGRERNQLSCYS
jgi:hypothetical protein